MFRVISTERRLVVSFRESFFLWSYGLCIIESLAWIQIWEPKKKKLEIFELLASRTPDSSGFIVARQQHVYVALL